MVTFPNAGTQVSQKNKKMMQIMVIVWGGSADFGERSVHGIIRSMMAPIKWKKKMKCQVERRVERARGEAASEVPESRNRSLETRRKSGRRKEISTRRSGHRPLLSPRSNRSL